MSEKNNHKFQTEEEKTIAHAGNFLQNKKDGDNPFFYDEYSLLLEKYKKVIHKMEKMVKMSDKQQQKTTRLNEKLDILSRNLSKYVSPQIYQLITSETEDIQIHSQRKKLTIFFSDIVTFSNITENLQPEDITKLLNEYLDEMSQIALKYGGTIDKFIGDAIMIFFGDPESQGLQEDAVSCVAMGLEMQKRLVALRSEWISRGIIHPFQVRMGITSGFCTVGNFGSRARLDYTIIGSHVNLASRLQSSANPDDILISHETYALIKNKIYCEKKGTIMAKGIPYPIQTYKVIDFYDNIRVNDEINEYFDGFSIYLNLDQIPQENVDSAIESLNESLKRLNQLKNNP